MYSEMKPVTDRSPDFGLPTLKIVYLGMREPKFKGDLLIQKINKFAVPELVLFESPSYLMSNFALNRNLVNGYTHSVKIS